MRISSEGRKVVVKLKADDWLARSALRADSTSSRVSPNRGDVRRKALNGSVMMAGGGVGARELAASAAAASAA